MKKDESSESTLPPLLLGCQSLVRKNGVIVGSEIAAQIRSDYPTLLSAIPTAPHHTGPAFLASIDGRLPLTHDHAAEFIQSFGVALHTLGIGRGHRVALVLPNGPELALAILGVAQWATCVPLSATGAVQELEADLQRCGADLVIGPYSAGVLPAMLARVVAVSGNASTTPASSSTGASTFGSNATDTSNLKALAETFSVLPGLRDWTVHRHVHESANKLAIPFVGLVPDPSCSGPFRLWLPTPLPPSLHTFDTDTNVVGTDTTATIQYYSDVPTVPTRQIIAQTKKATSSTDDALDHRSHNQEPNTGHDEALVLFTSGTTGNKKLVAHQIADILTAATTIALSWQLGPTDVNCNLMPLFHVGGIVRQVFSPLLSGGCVVCCPSFDADLFWALLQRRSASTATGASATASFNWYYAAPTMHSIILETGKTIMTATQMKLYRLKMIANAAGGLLPSLAQELRETFGAAVLPSYGMTECMPISSPPADYDLSKPGTSGVPVGPEVAILNTATIQSLPVGEEGPICVRGEPCFRGYGVLCNDPTASKPESFLKDGWFNTGDLGHLDADGYLYITGRSKEVINSGGEIISPMEVEEAVIAHPDVRACAAFAADHNVLQETVGIVIVPEPGRRRSLDLTTLHVFIAKKLATPKWPQCIVFMEGGLPKSHTNKLLRVKLGSRLGLPEFTDAMSPWERTFDSKCPPQGTPLTAPIPSAPVEVDPSYVQRMLRKLLKVDALWIVSSSQRLGALVAHVREADVDRLNLIEIAIAHLHRYEVPLHICFVESTAAVSVESLSRVIPKPKDAVASILSIAANKSGDAPYDPLVEQVQDMFMDLLDLDYIPAPDASFFLMGGNSMRASQLASQLRKTFAVACSGSEIFHHNTCVDLAELIRARDSTDKPGKESAGGSVNRNDHDAPFSSSYMAPQNSWEAAALQLVPLFFTFPLWQISRYLLFLAVLLDKSNLLPDLTDRDLITFLIAYVVFHLAWITVGPLVFVIIKWTVIGRYEQGRYPIWGPYYLRWWFVDICRKLFLRGIWGSSHASLRMYYRMLGAKIEPGARISMDCELAEFDLVTVGSNAAVDLCTLRGFGVDNGAMILGPVSVGNASSVGMRSVVAPYTSVPDDQHLGPVTSTYDTTPDKAFHPKHARVNRQFLPEPSMYTQIIFGWPLTFLVNTAAQIPPMFVLYSLLLYKSRENGENFFSNWNELMDWLCDPQRIPFFLGIRVARALLSPFFYMFFALLVKWTVIGKIEPGSRDPKSEREKFKLWLAAALFPRKKVQSVTDLIGRHYENVSILYRLLGAKVGKRVFWPGNQPICNGCFDLLEIGDDCVFGSRSSLICTSVDRCDKIILCAGANVSDNCVVLPGTVVGKNAVLGSNSISPEGMYLPAGSVYFGSAGSTPTCLERGDGSDATYYKPLVDEKGTTGMNIASEVLSSSSLPMAGDETTIRPFGKAVYQGKAKGYRSLPLSVIIAYTWMNRLFHVVFHTLPLLFAIQFGAVLLYSDHIMKTTYQRLQGIQSNEAAAEYGTNQDTFLWFTRNFDNNSHHHTFISVFLAVLTCFLFTHFFRVVGWLIVELSAKWIIMGRRKPGQYNYDTSDYAQRWEMYQLTAKIRKLSRLNLLQFISGTPFMNWYIRWNGGAVGKDCCLYPAGADPFMPEPDLVTIGDGSVVDCASIVCHLNTRGNFQLAPITIERHCTLRTRSRVQQGVHMEEGSQLLEKSLAMTGEIIDRRSVWQGGPATLWFRYPDTDVAYTPPSLTSNDMSKEGLELGHLKKR